MEGSSEIAVSLQHSTPSRHAQLPSIDNLFISIDRCPNCPMELFGENIFESVPVGEPIRTACGLGIHIAIL